MPPLPERELLGLFMLNCSSREILQESKKKGPACSRSKKDHTGYVIRRGVAR
jgi:hypothetical protein